MADNYDHDALIELCNQIDLLTYASESIDFEKRGSNEYAAHCPLHTDNTPSLMITESKNLFYCHSCHVGGNLINWMMSFEGLSCQQAVGKIGRLTGTDVSNLKQCDALKFYKTMRDILQEHKEKEFNRKILDDSVFEQFDDEIPQEWLDEGISEDAMKRFNIRVDKKRNRIVYPVYDNQFRLIGFKGRTRYQNFKKMGIKKYMNYSKIGTTDYFAGMKENYKRIKANGKAIIFEGIKSVMKAFDWGYDYTIAAETSCLNDDQIRILIQMQVKEVMIAFDSDVTLKSIRNSTELLCKFTNVYVIKDRRSKKDRLLGEKEAPVDQGREVFEKLLQERRKL